MCVYIYIIYIDVQIPISERRERTLRSRACKPTGAEASTRPTFLFPREQLAVQLARLAPGEGGQVEWNAVPRSSRPEPLHPRAPRAPVAAERALLYATLRETLLRLGVRWRGLRDSPPGVRGIPALAPPYGASENREFSPHVLQGLEPQYPSQEEKWGWPQGQPQKVKR